MAQSTRLLTPLFTLASVLAAGSCSSANQSAQTGQSTQSGQPRPPNAEQETATTRETPFDTQVSFTPLQDFATKPMALRAGRLEGTPEEVLAQVDYIARPGQDIALLMSCEGRTWRYDVNHGSSVELKDTQALKIPHREETRTIDGLQSTCSLQVEPGIYWELLPNKERVFLSRSARDSDGSLVKTHIQEEIRRNHLDRDRDRDQSVRPIGVATNLIAFAEPNAIIFYEVPDDSIADSGAPNANKLSVTRFQWDNGLYGTPLSAGRTHEGHWILTRKNLIWFATRSDEQRQSEWLQVETVPVNFDEVLRTAISNKDSALNVFIADRAAIKSHSSAHSLSGLVFLKQRPNLADPLESSPSTKSTDSIEP